MFDVSSVPVGGLDRLAPETKKHGVRYRVARDGLWREVDLPWLFARQRIAPVRTGVPMPFGPLEATVEFRCNPVPLAVVDDYRALALAAWPNEHAGALVWNEKTGQWRVKERRALSADRYHIRYAEVDTEPGEHLVVDVHSHGAAGAFFSAQDDLDDCAAMKVAMVIGSLMPGTRATEHDQRLCLLGAMIPMVWRVDKQAGVAVMEVACQF